MAIMVPEIPTATTAGERALFNILKKELPTDCICYYEPHIYGKRPDYLIIIPNHGIVVLEVKDYKKNTIAELAPDTWKIIGSDGNIVAITNPIEQARQYAFAVARKLQTISELVQAEGRYVGNLKFPYTYLSVFTRLNGDDIAKLGIDQVIDPSEIISRDLMDSGNLFMFLLSKLSRRFKAELSAEDVDKVRYALFPEIRIKRENEVDRYDERGLLKLSSLAAMDLHQEQLAKQMGDGHRMLRGVAGSGKTYILVARAKLLLTDNKDWKMLLLCFGVPFSRQLRSMVEIQFGDDAELKSRITVMSFHEWLTSTFKVRDEETFFKNIDNVRFFPEYDAIAIDECQDFKGEWLDLVKRCLNPETNSLFIVEDKVQDIFKRKVSLSQATGLDFRGRSRILRINYRNNKATIELAWSFFKDNHSPIIAKSGNELIEIIPPESTERKGTKPVFREFNSVREQWAWIGNAMKNLHNKYKIPYREMAVFYRARYFNGVEYVSQGFEVLATLGIPMTWVTYNHSSKKDFNPAQESVKLLTFDSSKGLDYRFVFIIGLEMTPFPKSDDVDRETSLLYTALTRSTEVLCVTTLKRSTSSFTQWFRDYFNNIKE